MLVVNASRKEADLAHLRQNLGREIEIEPQFERALLALQGPMAASVLARLAGGGVERMKFMSAAETEIAGAPCLVTRSGYTGEDGFELSLAAEDAVAVAEALLDEPEVAPVGLGARDTLRLEAGLCLYGHDIDATTTPVEAGLAWAIGKRRREAGDFPGASTILRQLADGPRRKRVGIRPDGRAPAREGTAITDAEALRSGGSRAAASARRSGHRSRWAMSMLGMQSRAERWRLSSAMCRDRRGSRDCRSSRPAITGADPNTAQGGNE